VVAKVASFGERLERHFGISGQCFQLTGAYLAVLMATIAARRSVDFHLAL